MRITKARFGEIYPGRGQKSGRGLKRLLCPVVVIIGFLTLLTAGAVLSADNNENGIITWRVVHEVDSAAGGRGNSSRHIGITVKMNLVKIQDTAFAKTWIYNLDTERFWFIDYRKHTFSEDTFDNLRKYYADRNADEKTRLEAEKKRLEAAEGPNRAQSLKDIGQRLALLNADPGKFKIKQFKKDSVSISGLTAKPVEVSLGGNVVETLWVVDKVAVPEGWKRFLDYMGDINPVDWMVEAAVGKMALKGESRYGGVQKVWETQSLTFGSVMVNEFMLPPTFTPVPFNP